MDGSPHPSPAAVPNTPPTPGVSPYLEPLVIDIVNACEVEIVPQGQDKVGTQSFHGPGDLLGISHLSGRVERGIGDPSPVPQSHETQGRGPALGLLEHHAEMQEEQPLPGVHLWGDLGTAAQQGPRVLGG